jgi:predicted site-specific integrase-resolvase
MKLIPLTKAAGEFGVHRSTLTRYIRLGRLTVYTQPGLGNVHLLDHDELTALFQPTPLPRPTQGEPKK